MTIKAPQLWKNLSDITIETLRAPWYKHIAKLENTISCETYSFYREKGLITMHLPITTGSISSPMGRGSDSSPVKINLFGIDTYLADSMQFMLEYGCRIHANGCYYVMPSFRGEAADQRHLCQFYHSEVEIPGTLEDIINLAEEYICHLAMAILKSNFEDVAAIAGDTKHIEQLICKKHFPRVTMDEAVKIFDEIAPNENLYDIDEKYGFRNINKAGEAFLMKKFGGMLWITHFDHFAVPFYQAYDESNTKALNADLLLGIGEVIGAGQRHKNIGEVRYALQNHAVDAGEYEWYMKMKSERPLQTSGFGMGIERFMLWVLKHDDIRDCQILPRFNGIECMP